MTDRERMQARALELGWLHPAEHKGGDENVVLLRFCPAQPAWGPLPATIAYNEICLASFDQEIRVRFPSPAPNSRRSE